MPDFVGREYGVVPPDERLARAALVTIRRHAGDDTALVAEMLGLTGYVGHDVAPARRGTYRPADRPGALDGS